MRQATGTGTPFITAWPACVWPLTQPRSARARTRIEGIAKPVAHVVD